MGAPWWSKATALISSITKSEQMNKMNKIEYNCVALSVTVAGDRYLVLFGKNRKQTMLLYMYFICTLFTDGEVENDTSVRLDVE